MMMGEKKIEELAGKILNWLIENELWSDCRIYFNGKAYATDNGLGGYKRELLQDGVYVLYDIKPKDYFEYAGDILSMSFEGDLYEVFNGVYGEFGSSLENEFSMILEEYGLYYELGNAWNLSVYPV